MHEKTENSDRAESLEDINGHSLADDFRAMDEDHFEKISFFLNWRGIIFVTLVLLLITICAVVNWGIK